MNQNQQFTHQANAMMPQPPAVISTKDALYLTDMLSWNLLAMKKANFYASNCQDQEVISQINKCGQMHQRHYTQILKHLNSSSSQSNPFGAQ